MRLFNNLTVRENIETAALARGDGLARGRQEGRPAARRVRPDEPVPTSSAVGLSFGDKRRVEIARALAADPVFLLLDEPAAGMNEAETEVLLQTLPSCRAGAASASSSSTMTWG